MPAGTYSEIIFCNVSHSTIENVDIDNANTKNDGILLINSKTIHIRNNLINSTNGMSSINSDYINIYDNNITFSKNDGISMDNSEDSRIYNNTIENNNRSGILVSAGSNKAEIFNNTIKKNYKGIEVSYSDDVKIRCNTIHQNTEDGIEIKGSLRTGIFKNDILGNKFGLFFDHHTNQSTASHNNVCYNSASDIYNNGLWNTGENNTCSKSWRWGDAGTTYPYGCKNKCIGGYQYNYGYRFKNPSKYPLSFGCPYNACQGDMVDTFGLDQVYLSAKICALPLCFLWWCICVHPEINVPTPIPDPNAAIYYTAYYHHCANPGSCTGMSTTSLQFYYKNNYPSYYNSSAQKASDLAYTGCLENLIDSKHGAITSWEVIKPFLKWLKFYLKGGSNANNVLSQVKQSIQSGNLGSIVMTSESLSAHTVVATNVRGCLESLFTI